MNLSEKVAQLRAAEVEFQTRHEDLIRVVDELEAWGAGIVRHIQRTRHKWTRHIVEAVQAHPDRFVAVMVWNPFSGEDGPPEATVVIEFPLSWVAMPSQDLELAISEFLKRERDKELAAEKARVEKVEQVRLAIMRARGGQ
jgi:hypothetical protein